MFAFLVLGLVLAGLELLWGKLQGRKGVHPLDLEISELEEQCLRLNSPDTFAQYAKASRKLQALRAEKQETPVPDPKPPVPLWKIKVGGAILFYTFLPSGLSQVSPGMLGSEAVSLPLIFALGLAELLGRRVAAEVSPFL
mmetsp:Transcript_47575/g.125844  ORF Transcript_47575/g.125844 Transcript_47575/m.125844 type:complete len:140 (-) Transcript_47575:73-492(-)